MSVLAFTAALVAEDGASVLMLMFTCRVSRLDSG